MKLKKISYFLYKQKPKIPHKEAQWGANFTTATNNDQENALASVSARTKLAYTPLRWEAISVSWLPYSVTTPLLTTAIMSASLMVESRWATTTVVARLETFLRASWTCFSDSKSNALLASSRSSTLDFFSMALAMAILCF